MVAIPLDRGGSSSRDDELPAAPEAWRLEVTAWSYDVRVVGDVLLGYFVEGELWAVDGGTGRVLWRLSEDSLPGRLHFGTHLLYLYRSGRHPSAADQPNLRILGVPPRELPHTRSEWVLDVPSAGPLLGTEETEGDLRTLGATADTFFQFDRSNGKLLWVYSFNRGNEPGPWTNLSANTDAAFLYFEDQAGPGVLKRVPILAE